MITLNEVVLWTVIFTELLHSCLGFGFTHLFVSVCECVMDFFFNRGKSQTKQEPEEEKADKC